MHIFVDESGTFTRGPGQRSVSGVGALIIPDVRRGKVEKQYERLRSSLLKGQEEVKGRLLSERDVDALVSMLARHEVLFEMTAIDLAILQDRDLAEHQGKQAEKLTERITNKHHSNVRAQVFELRHRLEEMPHQLYVQSVVTFELIATVLERATMFYCQRSPKELAAFNWVIDSKDSGRVTEWERWWSFVVMPALQFRALRKPMVRIDVGDYSHFQRFRIPVEEYMRPHLRDQTKTDVTDLRKVITESFRFSSASEPGLEMVDILTNATRRALMGNLGIQGWGNIRRLMIHRPRHYIELITLLKPLPARREWLYMPVLRHFSEAGKDMLAPRFRSAAKSDR